MARVVQDCLSNWRREAMWADTVISQIPPLIYLPDKMYIIIIFFTLKPIDVKKTNLQEKQKENVDVIKRLHP